MFLEIKKGLGVSQYKMVARHAYANSRLEVCDMPKTTHQVRSLVIETKYWADEAERGDTPREGFL